MNDVYSTIAWCALQVSLLAMIGVTIAALVGRRSASLACSVLFSAASTAAILTVLAPLPIHGLFVFNARQDSPALDAAGSHAAKLSLSISNSGAAESSNSIPNMMFTPQDLLAALQSVGRQAAVLERAHRPLFRGTSLLLLAIVSLGLLRLAAEVLYVLRTRRASVPLNDSHLLGEIRNAALSLKCRTVPELRMHPEFSDAAIVGWFRPMLILPRDCAEWTPSEQRAVITHEMAHVVRHDAPWRMMASCVLAMHFYNPIVHWLLRRAVLYQELSTDQLAAGVIGQRDYLRSLSSLAIRRDDTWGRTVSPRILPVFSGHLIRRINVLNSKEGIRAMNSRRRKAVTSALISAAFLVAGLATIATRGIAQSPPEDSKPKLTVQPVSVKGTGSYGLSLPSNDARAMFHRLPIDPEVVGSSNPYGMAVGRIRELFANPAMQPFSSMLNGVLAEQLTAALKLKTSPAINIGMIEWIAARPCLTTKAATDKTKSMLMMGTGGFVIKLNQPFDLKSWIEENQPDLTKFSVEGGQSGQTVDVYQFLFSATGPNPVQIWMQDPMTLLVNLGGKSINPTTKMSDFDLSPQPWSSLPNIQITTHVANPNAVASWTGPWSRIDRGLGSALFPKCDNSGLLADFKSRPDFQTKSYQEMGQLYEKLCAVCQMTGLSFDIAGEAPQFGLRVSMVHASPEAAAQSEQNLRELIRLWQVELVEDRDRQSKDKLAEDDHLEQIDFVKSLLDAASFEVNQVDETSAELLITSSVPFAKFLTMMQFSDKVEKVE